MENEIIIYQTQDGQTKIDVRLENETVWLTQNQMAELFQTTKQNISSHMKNIFEDFDPEKYQAVMGLAKATGADFGGAGTQA